MRKILGFFLVLLFVSIAFAINRNARPVVGEKQDSAVTPNATGGPRPRNEQNEIYRGPPSGWDEGRVLVDVQGASQSSEHQEKK